MYYPFTAKVNLTNWDAVSINWIRSASNYLVPFTIGKYPVTLQTGFHNINSKCCLPISSGARNSRLWLWFRDFKQFDSAIQENYLEPLSWWVLIWEMPVKFQSDRIRQSNNIVARDLQNPENVSMALDVFGTDLRRVDIYHLGLISLTYISLFD